MKMWRIIASALAILAVPAHAETKMDVHALVLGNEGARFLKGVATLDQEQQLGAVQVRFLGFDHHDTVFAVGVFNAAGEPANFGIEDIHATVNGADVEIFSAQELTRQARNRATWGQILLGLAGAISSASAASSEDYYHGSVSGPGGTYMYSGYGPSVAGQIQANRIADQTAYGIVAIQQRLDATVAAIGDRVVQLTTVDPGSAYGGLVFVDRVNYDKAPLEMRLTVDWNGERYPFGFLLLKPNQAVPSQYASLVAEHRKPIALKNHIVTSSPTGSTIERAPDGAIFLPSGAIKIPAKTKSGFCLKAPANYVATGDQNYPVITGAMPRCENVHESPPKEGLWQPLKE
jgi:hypothetical protein